MSISGMFRRVLDGTIGETIGSFKTIGLGEKVAVGGETKREKVAVASVRK